MSVTIFPMEEQYKEYLIDESKFTGNADSISFPETESEIREVLEHLGKDVKITIQGGKTGITGAAVPEEGQILNLSHMNKVKDGEVHSDGTASVTVEPGITLMDLKKEIDSMFRKTPVFWPPDPTETSATVGGVAAENAEGICRILYGPARDYIEKIRVLYPDGTVQEIGWGEKIVLASGKEMEKMDTVLGKEGITGIITELTLKLLPKPESLWGIAFFFRDTGEAGQFVDSLKEELPSCETAAVAAVEYIDRKTMDLIEERKPSMSKIKELPDIEQEITDMVYLEIQGQEEGIEEIAECLMEKAAECGSDPDEAWAVSGEAEIEKMHAFRHAAAETANLFIEGVRRTNKEITKLGTDMAVADAGFSEILKKSREDIAKSGLSACIFGHAMENHLHINLLPENKEEYEEGIRLLSRWAKETSTHGKVIGEHGIGKLKKKILGDSVPGDYLEVCRELKQQYDSVYRLNPGNIIETEE